MREEDIISTKLFVGNLNFDTTQQEIESLFGEVGEIRDIFLPSDRDTGRPRGFAFVEFVDDAAATAAIERFDGYELGGRNLRVNEAQERPRRSPGPRSFSDFSDADSFSRPRGPKIPKPKGSRRNLRSRKRSF